MNWVREVRAARAAVAAGLLLVLAGLTGCGGGEAAAPAQPAATLIEGALNDGRDPPPPDQAVGRDVTLRGVAGLARRVSVDSASGAFRLSLQGLSGPYVLGDAAAPSEPVLFALTAQGGHANLTPLTTLLMAQLTGQEPRQFYASIAQQDAPALDDATVAAAEQAVADYLALQLGVNLPPSVRQFVQARYAMRPGDPMHDAIQALIAQLDARGEDMTGLARRVALQSARCRLARIDLTLSGSAAATPAGLTRPFCPASASTQADAVDASITEHRFLSDPNDDHGSWLLRVRADAVLSATYSAPAPDGSGLAVDHHCANDGSIAGAPTCAGLTLDPADGSGARRIVAGVTLRLRADGGGVAAAQGTLHAVAPGAALAPVLSCLRHGYELALGDGRTDRECVTTDTSGEGGTLAGVRGVVPRLVYSLGSLAGSGQLLTATLEGDRLVSLVMQSLSGTYACGGADCAAAQLTPSAAGRVTLTTQVRHLTLADTLLARLLPDGSLDANDRVRVRASLTLLAEAGGLVPPDASRCTGASEVLSWAVSGQSQAYAICPPDDPFSRALFDPGDGTLQITLTNGAAESGQGGGEGLFLLLDATSGAVLNLRLSGPGGTGEAFACGRVAAGEPACSGVVLEAPDGQGNRLLRLSGVALREVETADFVSDRSATGQGQVLIPAPPPAPI